MVILLLPRVTLCMPIPVASVVNCINPIASIANFINSDIIDDAQILWIIAYCPRIRSGVSIVSICLRCFGRGEGHKTETNIYDRSALEWIFRAIQSHRPHEPLGRGNKDYLVSYLRGKAHAVLKSMQNLENLQFEELKSKLEMRFGEMHSL